MTVSECVLEFINAVNRADLDAMSGLMTGEHLFIDSDGSEVGGREDVCRAWASFFSMMKEYEIRVQDVFSNGGIVVVTGSAEGEWSSGGVPGRRWIVPAAWRAVVRDGRIAVWQVFTNPDPVLRAGGRLS